MSADRNIINPRLVILIVFLGISIGVAIGGYLFYDFRKGILREEKLNDLKAIADLKEAQIFQWKEERMEDAMTVTNNPFIRKNLQNIFPSIRKSFLPVITDYLRQTNEDFGYHSIKVYSEKGTQLFSTDPEETIAPALIRKYTEIGRKNHAVQFSGFDLVNDTIPYLNLISPCYKSGTFLGFFLLQLDPQKYLFPLIRFWPTPSKSSETLIISVQDDSVVFLNELRHWPHSSFRLKIPMSKKNVPAVMAVNGHRGFAEGMDYRNQPVIAYLTQIPGTDWYMVAKTDKEEIYESMRLQTIIITGSMILILLFTGIISYLIFRNYMTAYFIRQAGETLGLRSTQDIAERKRFEEQIRKLNRLYSTLLRINHAIIRAQNKENMFNQVCQILTEEGGYRMVSISQVVDSKVSFVAGAGYVEGYFDRITITTDDSPTGKGPTGTAFSTMKRVVCQDISRDPVMQPWRSEALKREYRSSAAFPVISKGEVSFVVNIYSDVPNWFDEQEILLLDQMATEMGYALEYFFLEHEREEIREELAASEERFHKVFNSMNDGVAIHRLVFDDEGTPVDYRLLAVNPMFETITSIPGELAINALASQLYQVTPAPFLDIYARVAQTGVPESFEVYYPPMDKHFRISAFSQEPDGFTTVFQNITEQVRAREYLKKINEELEKRVLERTAMLESANRELEAFAYSVSHDLKAPLRSISGFSQIILNKYSAFLDPEGQHYLHNIILAGENMHHLIEDLLRYSKLGHSPPEISPVDVRMILNSCLADLRAVLENSGARITFPDTPVTIEGNPLLIAQVFTNLIQNAICYQPAGQQPLVDISWEEDESHYIFSVKDNGIGIDQKFHRKVFNIFQRLHTEDEFPGTGIGLAIVKKAMELMNGEVWIAHSGEGAGSVFCIKFPKTYKS